MRRWIWVDVDGTCENGEPVLAADISANLAEPPVGRAYNYNLPLFAAIHDGAAQDDQVFLFTAYTASTAANTLGVLRCELIDYLGGADDPHRLRVCGCCTLLDPVYGKGPGRYYSDVIAPCERAVLASGKDNFDGSEVVPGAVAVLSSAQHSDPACAASLTFREIIEQEGRLTETYYERFGHPPNKERLARYCLASASASDDEAGVTDVVFFDDMPVYLEQVERACAETGVRVRTVRVMTGMSTGQLRGAAFSQGHGKDREMGGRSSCVVS
jgi:hypothetical protein